MLEKGEFFFTFDLKSGYHHVDIHKDYWQYLGFSCVKETVRKFYVFKVLPFGLATACFIFTKLLRPLVKRWRSLGMKVIMYIDDGICSAKSYNEAESHGFRIKDDLDKAGFVINVEKSLAPQKKGKWLGVLIDLEDGNYIIPEDKVEKLKANIVSTASKCKPTAREVASIVGQIISMSIALGPITRLRTREMYGLINQRYSWNDRMSLTEEICEELEFWQQNVQLGCRQEPLE